MMKHAVAVDRYCSEVISLLLLYVTRWKYPRRNETICATRAQHNT